MSDVQALIEQARAASRADCWRYRDRLVEVLEAEIAARRHLASRINALAELCPNLRGLVSGDEES